MKNWLPFAIVVVGIIAYTYKVVFLIAILVYVIAVIWLVNLVYKDGE